MTLHKVSADVWWSSLARHPARFKKLIEPALTTAIDTKRAELGLSRRPAPNPVAGLGSGDAPDTKPSSWAGAFAEHTGRAKPQ